MVVSNGGPPPVGPADEAVAVNLGHGVAQAPAGAAGSVWSTITIQLGLVSTTLVLPEKTLRDLAGLLPRFLVEAADEVRNARTGLIMPDMPQIDLSKLKP